MMQILEAAGIPPFTDNKRQADDSNREGYYEHDKVTSLLSDHDKSWIAEAKGRGRQGRRPTPCRSAAQTQEAELRGRTGPLQTSLHGARHGRNLTESSHDATTNRQILPRERKSC